MRHPRFGTKLPVLFFIAVVTAVWSTATDGSTPAARCIQVVDGDTLQVELGGQEQIVHLFGIDAPELDQLQGEEAAEFLRHNVTNCDLQIRTRGKENNALSAVVLCGGRDVAQLLLENGFAWLSESGDTDQDYAVALFMARGEERGLWKASEPKHPADWRREKDTIETPTPKPNPHRLADVASSIALKKDADGKIVIDAADAPSVYARRAEGRLFLARMNQIVDVKRWRAHAMQVWRTYCDSGSSGSTGSVWSEKLGTWVEGASAPQECDELSNQISQADHWIQKAGKQAMAEAERGGIAKEDVKTVAAAVGLKR